MTRFEEPFNDKTFDYVVSYGYRHILTPDIVQHYKGRAINGHISYLPWNRGADPNLWSWIDGTPKGVTIHYIDEGVDTGKVIEQSGVEFKGNETLATSYTKLNRHLCQEFAYVLSDFLCGRKLLGASSIYKGTYHSTADGKDFLASLPLGYDTPVSDLPKLYADFCAKSVDTDNKCGTIK